MTQKKVSLMDFNSNPNIGIYMFVNDKFCLIGQKINEKKKKEIEKTLEVPVYEITILGTELVGIFLAGNNEFIIIPEIFKKELDYLKKICKKHKISLVQISETRNTFGNNIQIGNNEILINSNFSKEFSKKLKNKTKLKIIEITSKQFEAIGSTSIFLNNKYFFSQEYNENDVNEIMDKIAGVGTINQGTNFIGSGVIGNSKGVIIGSQSSTIEIQNIVESLEYI